MANRIVLNENFLSWRGAIAEIANEAKTELSKGFRMFRSRSDQIWRNKESD